uniref:NADH-ubiquinone oxidoreductase chain 3 n=1 Tax=Falcolipeurus quadripustulatus TaxID=2358485 RepID=A0A386B2B1_9NEOP|nr:NADH dehydrogenase subunit 3 [Falcolipeurus quadripustulatus]
MMSFFFSWFFISIFLVSLIGLISLFFMVSDCSVVSNDPFECGFDQLDYNRVPICLHFFMIGILFLIFDIELVVCFPLLFTLFNSFVFWGVFWYMIIMILLLGLFVEIFIGSLDWKEE